MIPKPWAMDTIFHSMTIKWKPIRLPNQSGKEGRATTYSEIPEFVTSKILFKGIGEGICLSVELLGVKKTNDRTLPSILNMQRACA